MKYKLLALDMDGTTLNSQKKISPATAAAIDELLQRGIYVVVASGRGLIELSDYREPFKNMQYGILISGGLIFDFLNDKPISVHPVSFEDSMKLIEVGMEERAMIHLLTLRDSIAREQDINHMEDFNMGVYTDMFSRICIRCDDLKAYAVEHKDSIIKVNLYHRTIESRERSVEKLKDRNLQLVFAESHSLEASPAGVTKASGLVELCKYLNIDLSATVAIGDAPNDIEILKTVGAAVAMGNAEPEIKKLADFVTDDNDHDGVVKAIQKYF